LNTFETATRRRWDIDIQRREKEIGDEKARKREGGREGEREKSNKVD
jgi:hypothetical protein